MHKKQTNHQLKTNTKEVVSNKSHQQLDKETKGKQVNWKPWLVGLGVFVLLFITVSATLGFYTKKVANNLKNKASVLKTESQQTYDLFKAQNLPAVEQNLNQLDKEFQATKKEYEKLAFYSYIPVINNYYKDGLHLITAVEAGLKASRDSVKAITPYADVLGFSGETKFAGGTAEDRLKVILETLDKVTPILDDIASNLKIVETELNSIDAKKYPEEFQGIKVKENIVKAQEFSTGVVKALTDYRPVIEQLPKIAGSKEEKKYLILFQNDNELRPTGGFLTAYSIIKVKDGKVEAVKSSDIYDLDQKFHKKIEIPEALGKYLTTEKYWNLRDMNISPDLKTSMDTFFKNYKTVKGEIQDIDGIITVDTNFLTNLMKVLGPVEVPGYGTFSAEIDKRCDCPQIIYVLSEIITRPTPYLRDDRKGILGPLMRALLTKAYTAPKQLWPELFKTGFESIINKHAQFYFTDQEAQQMAEVAGVAGTMTPPSDGSDFLAIINSNLGGAKSNLFITYSVIQTVQAPEDGMLEKTVEITYKNNAQADNCNLEDGLLCLNSTLKDWTRLFIPQGSKLISSQGFIEEATTYDEAGFTVIDGFFTLEPMASAKLKVTYKVPYTDTTNYKLHIWKQSGVEEFETLMDVTGGQEKILIKKDIVYETYF